MKLMSTSRPEFVFHNLPSTYIVTVLRAREASSFDKINMLCCPKYTDSLYLASRGIGRAQICQHTLKIVTGFNKTGAVIDTSAALHTYVGLNGFHCLLCKNLVTAYT